MSARAAIIRVHALAINCPECNEGLGLLHEIGGALIGDEISDEVITRGQVFTCEACDADYRVPASAFNRLGAQ